MSFEGKTIVITGASSGIGAATAILFAKEGANVAIIGRNEDKLKSVADKIERSGKSPLVIKADVSKDDEAKNIIKQVVEKFGRLDVLVNNAGFMRFGSILDGKILEVYDDVIATNLRAIILLTTLALPHLLATKGNVINISSIASSRIIKPVIIPNAISKAGLDHFTRGAALELASWGVRVNSINPGPVKTDFLINCGASTSWNEMEEMTLLKKVAEPEEIADLIVYLASEKACSVTGSTFVTDNGMTLRV